MGPDETTGTCFFCIISLSACAGSIRWSEIRGLRMSLNDLLYRLQMHLCRRYSSSHGMRFENMFENYRSDSFSACRFRAALTRQARQVESSMTE